jgi:MoxR-like ATPase
MQRSLNLTARLRINQLHETLFSMTTMEEYPDLSDDDVKKIEEAMDFFDVHLRGKRAKAVPLVKEEYGEGFQGSNRNFIKGIWPNKGDTFLLENTKSNDNGEIVKNYYPLKYTVHLALGIPEWGGKFTSNRLEIKIKATPIKYVHKLKKEDWLNDKGVDVWGGSSSEVKETKSIPTKKSPSPIVNTEVIMDIIKRRKLVILEGVPGTGKTHIYKSIKKEKYFKYTRFLTFHPSSDYSTFVGGIRPGKNETTGKLVFNPTKGHLLKILDESKKGRVLLWIDELNRANVPRVFGDLISLIGNKKPPKLRIPNVGIIEAEEKLSLTKDQIKNLHIVATMNTSDRSVTPLDAALRRRFNFIRLQPMSKVELFEVDDTNKDIDFRAIEEEITCFEQLNECLNKNMGVDAMMGHSYLFEMGEFADDDSKRKLLWKYSILPNIIDTLLISHNFELIPEINTIIGNNTELKLVDSAQNGVGKGLGRMILVGEVP